METRTVIALDGRRVKLRNPDYLLGGEAAYIEVAAGRFRPTVVRAAHGAHARVDVQPGVSDLLPLGEIWIALDPPAAPELRRISDATPAMVARAKAAARRYVAGRAR